MIRRAKVAACGLLVAVGGLGLARSQAPSASTVAYEGARLIIGDGSAPIEDGVLVVQNGRIVAVGRAGAVVVPTGTTRTSLAGKTVMPALVNVHVHIGYEGYTTWSAANHTPANVLDHLRRQAYYGVAATQSAGSSPTGQAMTFIEEQTAGRLPPASRLLFMPGMAPPNGGPDAVLIKATKALNVVHEVTTAVEARAAVRGMAGKGLKSVKIWVDDRRGTYPKMPPEVYHAVIDEAHKQQMLVHAHAIQLADQKAVVSAGADVLVHTVGAEKVDDEYLSSVRQRTPYWTTVLGLGDRSEVCNRDPFVDQTYPLKALEEIRARDCAPRAAEAVATREANLSHNLSQLVAHGARLVLGTDAGIFPRHAFGWTEHHEMARWVELGVTPADAIVAATSRPAALLGLADLGTLAPGKSADFLVLHANPLADIRNTRQIAAVYLRGAALDRDRMREAWRTDRAR